MESLLSSLITLSDMLSPLMIFETKFYVFFKRSIYKTFVLLSENAGLVMSLQNVLLTSGMKNSICDGMPTSNKDMKFRTWSQYVLKYF